VLISTYIFSFLSLARVIKLNDSPIQMPIIKWNTGAYPLYLHNDGTISIELHLNPRLDAQMYALVDCNIPGVVVGTANQGPSCVRANRSTPMGKGRFLHVRGETPSKLMTI